MKDISKNTIEEIKQKNVRPISKSFFLMKRSVLWLLFILSILFGSIAGSIALFMVAHLELDLYEHLGHSFIGFMVLVFPYFWLVFLLGFSVFAYIFFRNTDQGYRYKTTWIILLSIIFSIAGGVLLTATPLPGKLETLFQQNIPFYRGLEGHRRKVWMAPDHGLLAGEIIAVISKERIELKDLKGVIWLVDVDKARWRGRLAPAKNIKIKIIGKMKSEGQFIAGEIRPWEGQRQRGRRRGGTVQEADIID